MDNNLSNLEPKRVFEHFEDICKIPRCSGNEKEISNYLVKFANDNGLEVHQDDVLNVVIKKPGSKGYEKAPIVILQGHMDMVCVKDVDVEHNFEMNPIECVVDGDFIRAKGTSLGADNGIALAYFLALLESDDIEHPPLEMLITTGEEVGMKGASNLDSSPLEGELLINMDSEEEGMILVSCAGGVGVKTKLEAVRETIDVKEGNFYRILLNGLRGGHSGVEIDKGRGNSNVIMGRVLADLEGVADYRIVNIEGGTQNNAIPNRTEATIYMEMENSNILLEFCQKWTNILGNELMTADPDINISAEKKEMDNEEVLEERTSKNLVSLLQLIPNGIQTMSMDIEGLVESSTNLGVVKTLEDHILLDSAVRSSVKSLKDEIINRITKAGEILDAETILYGDYPEWQYKEDSKLREIFEKIHVEEYGKRPNITAVHAGLECGFLKEKLGDIDMISFGPNLYDVHTTNEHMDISSARRIWGYLLMVLKEIR